MPRAVHAVQPLGRSEPTKAKGRIKLNGLVMGMEDRYGRCSIDFGLYRTMSARFKGHAAFYRVPER